MTDRTSLRRAFDRARAASEQRGFVYGLLGRASDDTPTECVVTDRPTFVWVRVSSAGAQSLTIAKNTGLVAIRADTPVKLRYEGGVLVIAGYDTTAGYWEAATGGDTLNQFGVSTHTHRIGTGLEYEVEAARLEPGRVYSSGADLTAVINGFRYGDDTYAGGTISLSSYVPSAGNHRWVLVGLNPATNAPVAAASSAVSTATALVITDLDAIAFAGYIPLGAFQITGGDSALSATSYDAREWLRSPANRFSDSEGDPADVDSAAADGSSNYAARRDHVHTIAPGTIEPAMFAPDALSLTQVQDLDRITFDLATGVLNVPPPLAGRRTGSALATTVAGDSIAVTLDGMTDINYDSGVDVSAPMCPVADDDQVVIVKTGYYRLWCQVSLSGTDPGVCRLTLRVTGTDGFTLPATFPIMTATGIQSGMTIWIPYSPRTVGDVLTVEFQNDAAGGVEVSFVSLMAELIE